jgi:hypothetical protein
MTDLIGDIHGHADKLEQLLQKWDIQKGVEPIPPRQKVVFVGDYIDRGPKIETLGIVKAMVDSGNTIALITTNQRPLFSFPESGRQASP